MVSSAPSEPVAKNQICACAGNSTELGLLKLIGIELISIAMGAALGGLGRATGEQWIPAVPIAMDLMWNAEGYTTPRGMSGLAKYGIGVALPYADKIYQMAIPLLDKF